MNNENKREMEQIQRGLEAFLERELDIEHDEDTTEYAGQREVMQEYVDSEEEIWNTETGREGRGYKELGDEEDLRYAGSRDEEDLRYAEPREEALRYMEPEYEDSMGDVEEEGIEYAEELESVDTWQEEEYEDWDRDRRRVQPKAKGYSEVEEGVVMRAREKGKVQKGAIEPQYEAGRRTRSPQSAAGGHAARTRQSANRGDSTKSQQPTERRRSTKTVESNRAGRSGKPAQAAKTKNASVSGETSGKPKGKKTRKKKSRFRRFIIAVAFAIILLGIGLYQLVGAVYVKMNYKEIASVTELPMQEQGVVNILLIGNDSRENGDDGRSDAMILLSVSSKTKTIYMTSLLRDMYVEIPGHDGNRLNAAYAYGGAELLMETIEKNFDISVNRYVLVNFEAFASLVDAVGGIDLELTSEEIVYVNGYLVEYNMLTGRPQGTDDMDPSMSGLVHLNGPQALAYSRNRYLGTDFGRTERQRKVLTAVIKKLPSTLFTNAGELMDGLLPNLTTNLTRNECYRLSLMAGKLLTYEIASDSIPQPGTYKSVMIRNMDVLEVDFGTNIEYLKKKLYGD